MLIILRYYLKRSIIEAFGSQGRENHFIKKHKLKIYEQTYQRIPHKQKNSKLLGSYGVDCDGYERGDTVVGELIF